MNIYLSGLPCLYFADVCVRVCKKRYSYKYIYTPTSLYLFLKVAVAAQGFHRHMFSVIVLVFMFVAYYTCDDMVRLYIVCLASI